MNFYADPAQTFPFYVYDADGGNRRENITDWALGVFRARYGSLPMLGEGRGGVNNEPEVASGQAGRGGVKDDEPEAPPKGWAIHYQNSSLYHKIKPLARQMRREPTAAEKHLWQRLRRKQVGGYKFRRQHVMDRFVVDFYCAEARLVIEVDGPGHDYTQEEDALRTEFLESLGLRVLRFTNGEVLQVTDAVVERLGEVLQQPHAQADDPTPAHAQTGDPTPALPKHGEGVREISKWDIFYYVYGLLHHPGYRARYADNLKRELPRIPMADDFWAFSDAGRALATLHLNYEDGPRYELEWATSGQLNYRVNKMKPGKKVDAEDGSYKIYDTLEYNDTLTLKGIPAVAFGYRLGNRSALDWVVDQYRVKTDKRSGIESDPNGYSDDEQYIVKLVEQVIQVSVATVAIVDSLARLPFRAD